MTIAYSVNGGSEILGVLSTWRRIPKQRQTTTGAITFQDYALNTWTVANMTMALFLTLQALSGKNLDSLETNDIAARKSAATYSAGAEVGLVNCQHVGLDAQQVTIQFRVKV